jgi:hypothetical protein
MSCEHLVCASCANPVAEGRCPVCRQAREQMHGHGPSLLTVGAVALLLIATLLLLGQYYS